MNALLIILIVAAVIALVWGLGSGLQFLWIIAIILAVVALIMFLLRVIRGNSRV